ncbi:hypothetical protein BGZ94_002916 [Podila epigama]|nr:hypothetical protein BGZ94_002916 [Podila epigama]
MPYRMAQCTVSEPSTMLSKETSNSNSQPDNSATTTTTTTSTTAAASALPQPPPSVTSAETTLAATSATTEESLPSPEHASTLLPSQHEQKQFQPAQAKLNASARPVSEIFTQSHLSLNGKSFQSPEAEAIDRWFEDLSHYEQTLEEMAAVSLDHVFKEELSTVESWFGVLSEAERTAALYSLLQHSSQVQIRFFITVLQQLAKKDPVGALLSPTVDDKDKDPTRTQLHAMAKAEKDVSQRLLSVLPIQPPTTISPLDRPLVGRRLYDRHSMTMGETEEYSRLFPKDSKRNSTDILGFKANHPLTNATGGLGSSGSGSGSSNGNSNSNNAIGNNNIIPTSNKLNITGTSASGLGNGSTVYADPGTRVNHFKLPQVTSSVGSNSLSSTSSSSSNRVSAPGLFNNRPKSVCEGEASSVFSSTWNFADLGGTPLTNGAGPSNNGQTSGFSNSPGNIGDRASVARPKSVGGTEWMLNGSISHRPQPGADGVEKSWTPLLMSPTMGGFHNGTNGIGHGFAGSSSGYSGSSLAVERPKSVTEADLAKLNISQWSLHNGGPSGSSSGSSSGGLGSQRSTLDDPMKSNRRRTLLRPSAIISNVPVTVLEGDEKLLSASANTSSINIVSSLFDEPTSSSTGTMPSLTAALTASQTTPSIFQFSSQAFSQPNQQQLQSQQQLFQHQQQQQQQSQQQQAVSQLSSLSLQQSQQQQASPMTSPLPSPITSGFRSRPASRPTSPGLTAHHTYSSVRSVWNANGNLGYNSSGHNHQNGSHYGNHYPYGGSSMMAPGHPMDYHQKRHLSPPDTFSRGTSVLDDDYMSDTSDMSSIGMYPHHRRGSMGKDKKQYEGVDFELLQDTPAWLRSLRLHKYNSIFDGMHWREIVNLSDGDLINKGVAALGARRKMLKVFEQVRKEMLLQGMTN